MTQSGHRSESTRFGEVVGAEILQTLKRLDLAFFLAWSDTRTRYRRSTLGPFWLVLGTAIGVGGLGFVWSRLFQADASVFIPSLTIGLVVWYLLSSCLTESSSIFYNNRELLLNIPFASLLLSLQLLLRLLVNFAHNFLVVIAVLLIYPSNISPMAFLAIPGFLLVCFNLLWVAQLFGYVGARFRDLEPLLVAIMQPLFFLTPVIFRSEQLGTNSLIILLNPFAHWLSLIRDPLMGKAPEMSSWIISIAMAIAGWALALYVTDTSRRRLSYWVN